MKYCFQIVPLLSLLLSGLACSPTPPQPELITPIVTPIDSSTPTALPTRIPEVKFLYLKENLQMWLADIEGENQRFGTDWSQIDNLIPYDYEVAPDNRRVVILLGWNNSRLLSDHGSPSLDPWQLQLLDLQTGDRQLLLNSAELSEQTYISRPARWSPQGDTIAYLRTGDIWFLNPETLETHQVTHLLIPDDVPALEAANQWDIGVTDFAWSPDGRQLALEVGRLWGSGIRWVGLFDIATGEVQALTPEEGDTAYRPSWTPEGKLSWIQRTEDQDFRVTVIYDLQTGQERLVKETRPETLVRLAWSPKNNFLAFSTFEDSYYSLQVFHLNSLGIVFEQEKLSPDAAELTWLSDEILIYRCSSTALCSWTYGQGASQPIIMDGYIPANTHISVKE